MKMQTTREHIPGPVPAPAGPGWRDAAPASYLTSSFELRAGLEVTALALSQLPADVLRELMRLRDSWSAPALPA